MLEVWRSCLLPGLVLVAWCCCLLLGAEWRWCWWCRWCRWCRWVLVVLVERGLGGCLLACVQVWVVRGPGGCLGVWWMWGWTGLEVLVLEGCPRVWQAMMALVALVGLVGLQRC